MIAEVTMIQPDGGLNVSDTSIAIEDNQCRALTNLTKINTSLESMRPTKLLSAETAFTTGLEYTDDILVYRKRNGTVQYMYATDGEIYYSTSLTGGETSISAGLTTALPIHMCQFNDYVYIFNGTDSNRVWDGTTLRDMGITPPDTAPVCVPVVTGTDQRTYYYTYYNEDDDIESDPSASTTITNAVISGVVNLTVHQCTNSSVTHYRVYRTGFGLVQPRFVKQSTHTPGAGTEAITDDVAESVVAPQHELEFDHMQPPHLTDAVVHNNRLFGWGDHDNNDTLYVSNEFEGEYMPDYQFVDSNIIKSGGRIPINKGDGSYITGFSPWGGAGLVFKYDAVYRVTETEVGYYGYQSVAFPGCIAGRSITKIPAGLVYLSHQGFVLLTNEEAIIPIGDPLFAYTTQISDLTTVVSTVYRESYVVSFAVGADRFSFTYNPKTGWSGPHTMITASSYFSDITSKVFGGRFEDMAGIAQLNIDKSGITPSFGDSDYNRHDGVFLQYKTKAYEFKEGWYARCREVRIGCGTIVGYADQHLTLNIYDENDILLDTSTFTVSATGSVVVGCSDTAQARYLAFEIIGETQRPIRISWIRPMIELVTISNDDY